MAQIGFNRRLVLHLALLIAIVSHTTGVFAAPIGPENQSLLSSKEGDIQSSNLDKSTLKASENEINGVFDGLSLIEAREEQTSLSRSKKGLETRETASPDTPTSRTELLWAT